MDDLKRQVVSPRALTDSRLQSAPVGYLLEPCAERHREDPDRRHGMLDAAEIGSRA